MTNSDATDSICPKNWKLPTSGTSSAYGADAPDKSYGKLVYSVLGFTDVDATSSTGGAYVRKAQQAPLWFPLAGAYLTGHSEAYSGLGDRTGRLGYHWSRRAYSSNEAYNMFYSTTKGNFMPQRITLGKYNSISVRCVFDPPTPTMQSFTSDECKNLATTTATADNRIMLLDSRDGKEYKIAKLADGNCWMVSNLALDGTDSDDNVRTLTSADSDVTADRTLAANITSGTSNATSVQIVSSVAEDKTTSCGSYEYCIATNTEKYGNLYNWYAATATTGTKSMTNSDATDSVCPKNWKLPTSGTSSAYGSSAPNKSYGKLLYSTLGFASVGAIYSDGGPYVQKVQQAPLWFPLAGNYGSGLNYQGKAGYYWSRKACSNISAAHAYGLGLMADGYLYPQYDSYFKSYGYSVRCVFNGS